MGVAKLAEELLGRLGTELKGQIPLSAIQHNWAEIAGPLARHSFPARFENGSLTIYAEHTAFLQELQILQNELKQRIQNKLNIRVHKIRTQKRRIVQKKNTNISNEPQTGDLNESEIEILKQIYEQI